MPSVGRELPVWGGGGQALWDSCLSLSRNENNLVNYNFPCPSISTNAIGHGLADCVRVCACGPMSTRWATKGPGSRLQLCAALDIRPGQSRGVWSCVDWLLLLL